MAGEIVVREARCCGVEIRPVDSEHSALWQCLRGEVEGNGGNGHTSDAMVRRLLLTASGGPFRTLSIEDVGRVTPERALAHPTWRMGRKVTIDSATLMNKGLEIIEARWLFDVPYDRIEVLLHPESIIHSMVEFVDGSIKAQLSLPDMRFPILYALTYPERVSNQFPKLELDAIGALHFSRPDFGRFPTLRLAFEAGRTGGTLPTVLSAADEVAVELFLAGRIGFADIWRLVESVMQAHQVVQPLTLDAVAEADAWARRTCLQLARNGG